MQSFIKNANLYMALREAKQPMLKEAVNAVAMQELTKLIENESREHTKLSQSKKIMKDWLMKSAEATNPDQLAGDLSFWSTIKNNPVTNAAAGLGLLGGLGAAAEAGSVAMEKKYFGGLDAGAYKATPGAKGTMDIVNKFNPFTPNADEYATLRGELSAAESAGGKTLAEMRTKISDKLMSTKSHGRAGLYGLGALGILGTLDMARGKDSLLRDYLSLNPAAVDMEAARGPNVPYIGHAEAIGTGAAVGAGTYAAINYLVNRDAPSLPKTLMAAAAGGGLGGIGASVYNNLTTDYLSPNMPVPGFLNV